MRVPLSPPPGLNSDDTAFSAEGQWAAGSNVRFRNGQPETIRGQVNLFTITGAIDAACFAIGSFKDTNGLAHLAYGTNYGLWTAQGLNSPSDITPVGLATGWSAWSLQSWGSYLLASPIGDTLYQYTGAGVATQVTEAPAQITCMLVTDQRQVLAFGANEVVSGSFNGMCIRCSDIEDYSSAGSWTPNSTNNADEIILQGPGSIIGVRKVGQYIAVWTDTALYMGAYIGDPSQSFRFDLVAEGVGLIGMNAVAVDQGIAYWLSPDLQLRQWSPGAAVEEIPCPIQKDFFDHLERDKQAHCIVSSVPTRGEIWVHYPDTRDVVLNNRCTRYIAYCVSESAMAQRPVWFSGTIFATAVLDSATLAPILGDYDPGAYLAASGLLIRVWEHGTTASGSALNWFIQTADRYLSNTQTRMMIRGIVPDIKDQVGDVSLTLYVRDRPQSTPVTKGPYTLTTTTTKKDFRASGMIVSARFSGGSVSGSYMRLGKPVFDTVSMGGR